MNLGGHPLADWRNNIGLVYEINNITLTIIGSTKVKYKPRKYILHCNVCSKDETLFPYGTISCTKSNLMKGQIPCGCRKGYRWSEVQNVTRVSRLCSEIGYLFHGWYGDYKGDVTYLDLENPVTNNRWQSTTLNNILHGYGDPVAGRIKTTKASTKSTQSHIKDFYSTGVFPEGTTFNRTSTREWEYTCGNCKNTFKGAAGHLKGGKMSCPCNGRSGGFDKSKPANFYIVRWSNEYISYLKFGITNREVLDRVKNQSRVSSLEYDILYTFHHQDGGWVADLESEIKANVARFACPKELLPDGYTETVHDTSEHIETLINYARTFNLKETNNE